jgi:hypothetical protein
MDTQSFEFKVAFEICLLDFIASCVNNGATVEQAKAEALESAQLIIERAKQTAK